MALLQDIINIPPACSGSEAPMVGDNLGCVIEDGNTDGLAFVKKGTRWASTTDFTTVFWQQEIQKGNVIPLPSAYEVRFTPPTDDFTESNTKIKVLDTRGLPEFEFDYKRDSNFDVELSKLRSFGQYDIVFFDANNVVSLASYGTQGYGGYSVGHVTPSASGIKTPGNVKIKTLLFQLININQYNLDRRQIVFENHGIDFKAYAGISPFKVTYPSNIGAGTTVQIKVTLNDGSPASGLLPANFKTVVDGTDNVVTAAPEVGATGVYDLTVTTALVAAEALKSTTWDSALAVPNIVYGAFIHRGSADTVVV